MATEFCSYEDYLRTKADNERLTAEIELANSRERKAFMEALEIGWSVGRVNDMLDHEYEWQQYRCNEDTDWRAVSETAKGGA